MNDRHTSDTDTATSPYTGRPITEWLDEEIQVYDVAGDKIGNAVEINPDFIVVQAETGFLGLGEPRYYYVQRSYLERQDDDGWYLNVDKDRLGEHDWQEAPEQSEWSGDWREGRAETETATGRTRLRRYEEEVDVDTVQRQAGEVVVNKRVVEDTKTVEVPIRREEVHIERRAVDDRSPVGADASSDAFSNESVSIPVMEEDVEIRKVARPVEEIEITKTTEQDTQSVDTTVRREEFDIDDQTRNH